MIPRLATWGSIFGGRKEDFLMKYFFILLSKCSNHVNWQFIHTFTFKPFGLLPFTNNWRFFLISVHVWTQGYCEYFLCSFLSCTRISIYKYFCRKCTKTNLIISQISEFLDWILFQFVWDSKNLRMKSKSILGRAIKRNLILINKWMAYNTVKEKQNQSIY